MKLNSKYASIAVLYPQIPRNFAWQPSLQFSQNLLSSLLHSHDCSYYVRRWILVPHPLWNIAWIQKHVTIIVFIHIEFTSFSFERQIYTPVCPRSTNLFRQLRVIYFMMCARMNLLPCARCSISTVESAYNHIGLCNVFYSFRCSAVPIYSSPLTVTLYSCVITTLVYNDTEHSPTLMTLYPSSTVFMRPY